MLDLVVSPSTDTRVKQKVLKPIWGKVSSEKLLNISINDIDWDYSSTDNVQDMWAELHGKLEAVAATVPAASVYLDNRPVKLPWSTTALKRMRKNKDRAWAEFDIDPTDINFSIAISKQHTFEEEEFKAKIKYEKKITSNLKQNCKAFYAYLRNKRQVKSSIVSLDRGDGTRTDTTAESAEVLATAFSSVFVHEPPGPLPKNESLEVNECVIDDMVIRSSDVKIFVVEMILWKRSIPSVPSSEVASEAQGTQEDKTAYSAISSVPLVSETEPFDLNSCIQISEGAPFSSFSVETIVNETMFTHTFRNRKAAYYGDYPYSYNGGSHKACDVSNGSHLSKLLSYVSVVYPSLNYNSVMVQLYDTGIDYMPAHSDNESCIAIGSDIVTISLGASRTLVLRDAENGDYIGQCTLDHGNVYVMSQETQNLVTHEIAQDPECFQKRISITLRLISPPTPSDTIISRPDLLTNPKNQQRAPVTSEPTPAHVKTPVSQKSALFISSSMFRFLDCQKLSSQALKANKFFYPGANATVMLNKLKKDLSGTDISPSVIYVMCGTNNVDSVYYGSQSLSEAVGDITKVIRYLKTVFPSSMVNFVNILPRYKLGRNDVVREINLNVKKFCLEQMINVMETEHLFNFKNGLRRNEFFAPPSAHISDNCHLNRSGVTKLGRHLKYWAHKHIS
ncbi:hypothetical protein ACHWQZ_G005353 [Mnemiopsis leidyi]